MQNEFAAHQTLEARAAKQREDLLLECLVQAGDAHNRSLATQVVLAGREKQALKGRWARS
jgi:hypothetical protein